jgi:uncharacterized iron-regulated protein
MLVLALACARGETPGAGRGGPPAGLAWRSPLERDHPLAGRLYDVAKRAEVSEAELVEALASARFVVLGEQHENEDHHLIQARLLRALVARGRAPAVAFEMLSRDRQPALDGVLADPAPSAEAVRVATDWDASGWPPFALYAPIFEAALAAGLPLVAADLGAEERKRLASDEPVPAALRARLGLDEPLPDEVARGLEADLLAAHCGELPASALPRLLRVQRGRDAELAQALLEAAGADGLPADAADADAAAGALAERVVTGTAAVLIAGAEHARRDRGAPRALARLAPSASVVAVALLEVSPELRAPLADVDARAAAEPPFDYVWYTPRASDEDYCERMRAPGRPPVPPRGGARSREDET